MSDSSETIENGLVTLSDSDLVEAWVRDCEQAALAVIVRRYSVMVLSVCRRRCRSLADADDAYQTTFLYLARNAAKIRRPECLPGWLHRVAQRASIATLTDQSDSLPMTDLPAEPNDPLDRLTQRHEAIVLDEELAALPDHYRSALVLHVFDDEPLSNLAERFGTTVGSIRGRLQRGKRLLAQRLRKRGIVPVFAFAAANAWTVSRTHAAESADVFTGSTSDGTIAEPPIDSSLLETLLTNGSQNMTMTLGTTGLCAGIVLLLMTPLTQFASDQQSGETSNASVSVLTIEQNETTQPQHAQPTIAHLAQVIPLATDNAQADKSAKPKKSNRKKKKGNQKNQPPKNNQQHAQFGGAGGGMGGMGGGGIGQGSHITITKPIQPKPDSKIAAKATEVMDEEMEFEISSNLSSLAANISSRIGIPVLIDERAVEFAGIDRESAQFDVSTGSVPVRTALRFLLQPHGLTARVENEGIVISADHNELVRRDIGVSRWINIDDEFERQVSDILQTKGDFRFVELPLHEAVEGFAKTHGLPIRISTKGLDEDGITGDEPVSIDVSNVTLRSALKSVVRQLDLTYVVRDESVVVTSLSDAEERLLRRVYWLESTGFATGDFQQWMDVIQTSFEPDTWENLGGPSTISPMTSSREALLIATTYQVHKEIEKFFKTLRESHHGPNPIGEQIKIPTGQLNANPGGGGFF